MDSLYDVCFSGQLLEGQPLHSVRQNIQKLFKTSPETLDILFSGETQLLKRGCDKATALKYKLAMERAGAKAVIRPRQASPEPSDDKLPTPTDEATRESSSQSPPAQDLDLSPVGSDVLRPEERKAAVTVNIDTSGLDLAAVGTTFGASDTTSAVAPDTSHLSMAEVGETIPNLASTSTPLDPKTDDIELSPEGSDFSDCAAPAAAAPEVDISNIEVAPAGSDVLEEQYKKVEGAITPDTDHISLQE